VPATRKSCFRPTKDVWESADRAGCNDFSKVRANLASSNRIGITSTFSKSSALRPRIEMRIFLIGLNQCEPESRTRNLSPRPGNPAPEPMSASRHLSTGIKLQINMDSPKWRTKISTGSTTEVKLTDDSTSIRVEYTPESSRFGRSRAEFGRARAWI